MVYILSKQRFEHDTAVPAFQRYRAYVRAMGDRLPPGARELASSDWYFDPSTHRSPHDAWLESASITQSPDGDQRRKVTVHIRLLGAYHDGYIELTYHDVRRYRIDMSPGSRDVKYGLRDWRFDEFRVSEDSRVEHEIEWSGIQPTGNWLIEAADVEYRWFDKLETGP